MRLPLPLSRCTTPQAAAGDNEHITEAVTAHDGREQ